jgi:multiple sugar transport system substrate-binding protein
LIESPPVSGEAAVLISLSVDCRTAALAALLVSACAPAREDGVRAGRTRIVFKHQPLWGDPAVLRSLLSRFTDENPDVEVVSELMPNAPEALHQFLLTTLESGQAPFDVFLADVVWVAEFVRAGFIADLSADFPPETLRRQFLPAATAAVIVDGRTFAVPWYADVGLLYYRRDLVPEPPRTYAALERMIDGARQRDPSLQGFLFQGRQYEGLVCNGYEAAWGHGADTEGGLAIDTPEMRAGLGWLRAMVKSGRSPPSVLSASEEESRRAFSDGRALFMRNWPYAWAELARESAVAGRVATAPLPTVSGAPGPGALGGWQLVVSASSPPERRRAASRLVGHLASLDAQVALALAYARNPTRRAAYDDPRLVAGAPFIAGLRDALERARPRPVTPYYVMLSDILQSEFSAVVAGVRPPAAALARAERGIARLTGRRPAERAAR